MNQYLKKPYLLYTLLFCVMAASIYVAFFVHLKSFLWVTDGYYQHWMAFAYYGRWLREIISNLCKAHALVIPEYDFSLGMGAGIIPTLHYYCIGDPFCLLSALVPMRFSSAAYGFLIFVRLYLAGIFFILYARYTGRRGLGLVAGALSYVFCGYALFAAVRHPFFINPMITFPLLLYGVEKIMREKKAATFGVVVAVTVGSNFYFAYMQGAFVCIYVFFRYAFFRKDRSIKGILGYAVPIVVSGLAGIATASAIFIPVVLAMFSSGRNGQPISSNGLYSLYYYVKLVTSFLVPGGTGVWVHVGLSVTGFLCAMAVFLLNREDGGENASLLQSLRWAVAATLVGFLIPFFGKATNGFGYVTNRWEWLFEFVAAYAVAFVWDRLWTMENKKVFLLLVGALSYVALLFLLDQGVNENVFAAGALLLGAAGALLLFRIGEEYRRPAVCLFFVMGILHLCANGHYLFDEKEGNYVAEFRDAGSALSGVEESDAALMAEVTGAGGQTLERYASVGSVDVTNAELLTGAHNTSFYWSIANGNVTQYMKDMALSKWWPWHYKGFEDRAYLSAAAAIGHVCGVSEKAEPPYGYERLVDEEEDGEKVGSVLQKDDEKSVADAGVCRNTKGLPAACTYGELLSEEAYERMEPYEKQEALLWGVVLSDKDRKEILGEFELGKKVPDPTSKLLEREITLGEGIELNADGSFTVKEKNAKMTISFEGLKKSETYLFIRGLYSKFMFTHELEDEDVELVADVTFQNGFLEEGGIVDEASEAPEDEESGQGEEEEPEPEIPADYIDRIYEFMDLTKRGWVESTTLIPLTVKGGGVTRTVAYFTPYDRHYVGQSDYVVNLGYHAKAMKGITVTFPRTGIYHAEQIGVVCQPMADYDEAIEARTTDKWKNERVTENGIEGDVAVKGDRLLVFSVPYADGWKAYVDGERAPLYQANVMYQAVPLHAGKHHVALVYHTPGLRVGLLVSFLGIIALAGIFFMEKRRGMKEPKDGGLADTVISGR